MNGPVTQSQGEGDLPGKQFSISVLGPSPKIDIGKDKPK
jgi:hypothetical protein